MYLVDHNADLNKLDTRGWSPLCHAVASAEFELGQQIIELCEKHGPRKAWKQRVLVTRVMDQILEHLEVNHGEEEAMKLRVASECGGFLFIASISPPPAKPSESPRRRPGEPAQ